ncbi:MAG: hypothetical protein AB7S26_29675 [Sandaracinaceae bacterium]
MSRASALIAGVCLHVGEAGEPRTPTPICVGDSGCTDDLACTPVNHCGAESTCAPAKPEGAACDDLPAECAGNADCVAGVCTPAPVRCGG